MDVFSEIKKLNFPSDQYVVIGGAALAARGMKETKDIDIVVSGEFFKECASNEMWHHHPRIVATEEAGLINDEKTVELYPTMGGVTSFAELRANTEMINGIPFASPEDIIKIKRHYGREKDLRDIKLIETSN